MARPDVPLGILKAEWWDPTISSDITGKATDIFSEADVLRYVRNIRVLEKFGKIDRSAAVLQYSSLQEIGQELGLSLARMDRIRRGVSSNRPPVGTAS